MTWKSLLVLCAAISLSACSEEGPSRVGGGGTEATGGSGGGGSGGTSAPGGSGGAGGSAGMGGTGGSGGEAHPVAPRVDELERLGSYLPAPASAMLLGVEAPIAIVGYKGIYMPSAARFGMASPDGPDYAGMAAGLAVLDTTSGKSRLYTNGLPTTDYGQTSAGGVPGPAPVFDLAWVQPDRAFAAAMWTHVAIGKLDEAGVWTFRHTTLRAPGHDADAIVTHVAVVGGALYAGTVNQGVAVLHPETLVVQRWLDLGAGDVAVYDMAPAVLDVPVLVVAANERGAGNATELLVFSAGAATGDRIPLPAGSTVTQLVGTTGGVYIGAAEADWRGVVYALVQREFGRQIATVVSAADLAAVHGTTLTPNRLALDLTNQRLLVGAVMKTAASHEVAGVAVFDLVAMGQANLPGRALIDRRRGEAELLPWQTNLLVADAQGRVYVGGVQRCSEVSARPTGVFRIENVGADPEDARLVRPWISGVRSIAVDPVAGHTWLGLRDENPGFGCDGYVVQASVCRLKADGSCEIYAPPALHPEDETPAMLSAMRIAFGDPAERKLAIATHRNGTFLRIGDTVGTRSTQMEPGVSLEMTSAAWSETGLWIASTAMWNEGTPGDDIDWSLVNDRSPHGLGYLEFSEDGTITFMRRYSRNQSDQKDYDLPGMPSNHARDVIALPGARHALVALGLEREMMQADHIPPADNGRAGGIVEIEDDQIRRIAPPEGAELRDVVALAAAPNGAFYALDAEEGVFLLDLETHEARLFGEPAWSGVGLATALAVDGAGHVAVGTTGGLFVYGPSGLITPAVPYRAHGTFWSLRFLEDGVLYAGADQGLVRIALDGAELPEVLGPVGPLPRTLWSLPATCDGEQGCDCVALRDCANGLACECSDAGCACAVPPSRCDLNPGDVDCSCRADGDCLPTLLCVADGDGSVCLPDPALCMRSCTCTDQPSGCPVGSVCQSGLTGSSCVPEAASCMQSCGCDGGDGCPATYHCDGIFYAGRCIANSDPCLADCSCSPEPCLHGYLCEATADGQQCVVDPTACLADCSCGGTSGCPGGYVCDSAGGGGCVVDTGDPCEQDCSCTGGAGDGCPTGMFCAGTSCVDEPDPCLAGCTCTENPDGCQNGYHCQGGFAGRTCVPD